LHEGRGSEEELRGLRQRQTEVDSFYCATGCEVCSLTWILSADGVISSNDQIAALSRGLRLLTVLG
jgi:hypothetical protein